MIIRISVVFPLIFIFFFLQTVYGFCGDGVLDSGEFCDPLLVTCCNSTCTGFYDLTSAVLSSNNCGLANPIFTSPTLTDPTLTYLWIFTQAPIGTSPYFSNTTVQSTTAHFNANGFYEMQLQITTQYCGVYFSDPVSTTVTDCCGNGILDQDEECDYVLLTNGCCDSMTCQYAVDGTPCVGAINDQCTTSLTCNSTNGLCLSDQNKPFSLTPQQPVDTLDTACTLDQRQFDLHTLITDSLDNTAGSYLWNVTILDQFPSQHLLLSHAGTIMTLPSTHTTSVKMIGGGYIRVRLTVIDSCGLLLTLDYNITRTCCGNMVLNTGEACDDGNLLDGDYCAGNCSALTGFCGDAILQTNELCDPALQLCCGPTCQSILPAATPCRPSFGDCDLAEVCSGMSPDCPPDVFKNAMQVCRVALGGCDAAETCSSTHPVCPPVDSVYPTSYVCRQSAGQCDIPEMCDGVSVSCPADLYSTALCRAAVGQCDVAEYCPNTGPTCPVDLFQSSTTPCDLDGAGCTMATCDGGTPVCTLDSTTTCAPDGPLTSQEWCITSACTLSTCVDTISGATCFIDGECYNNGDVNPANGCQQCVSTTSQTAWTNRADGTVCLTLSPTGSCSASVDQCIAGVCVDQYLPSSIMCRASVGPCDIQENCTGVGDYCPQDSYADPTVLCRNATDICDAPETCSGYGPQCPADRVLPTTTVCRPQVGPCDISETCDGMSTACPPDVFKNSMFECRSSAGPCDTAEHCSGLDADCPPDVFVPPTTICRVAAGICDLAEQCTGVGPQCPPDQFVDPSIQCRPSVDLCDQPEYCTGLSILCPLDSVYPMGTICRPLNGSCDLVEVCTGMSIQCPADIFQPPGFVCRSAVGTCDLPEQCPGGTPTCPADTQQPPSFACRPSIGPCDISEFCVDDSGICPPDVFRPSTYECRAANGLCDAVENCTGTGGLCPADLKLPAATVCRSAFDVCDLPEVCDGIMDDCPVDVLQPNTHVCRSATSACDPQELCTGFSPSCPADGFLSNTTLCRPPVSPCDLPEYCNEITGQCDADLFADANTQCRLAVSQCDLPENCTGLSTTCPVDSVVPAMTPCDQDGLNCTTDECDGMGICATISTTCNCVVDADCIPNAFCMIPTCISHVCQENIAPGFCFIDGQCLPNGATNPLNQCEQCTSAISQYLWTPKVLGSPCSTLTPTGECSAQDTCNGAGVCVDQQLVGQLCRASVSVCDTPEVCISGSEFCPTDQFANSSVSCRNSTDLCDAPEYCSGSSPVCPSDVFAPSSLVCRPATGLCDEPEYCTGLSKVCPGDLLYPLGVVCRPSMQACDLAEVCSGTSHLCPSDSLQPAGFVCRPPVGQCDLAEVCDGLSASCGLDQLQPFGYICRPATGPCDEPEHCDGLGNLCPVDVLSPTSKVCRPLAGGCDVVEHCTNTSATCPPDLILSQGTVCRPAVDLCDRQEVCNGVSNQCPINSFAPSNQICRVSTGPCDVTDFCTGHTASCPLDITRPNGFPCLDSIFCNGDEYCFGGVCQPNSGPRNCSDLSPCTVDVCNEQSHQCVHTPLPGIGMPCYTGPMGTANVGICRSGLASCALNGSLVCNGQTLPQPVDICNNGLDDNCNGVIDEFCNGPACVNDTDCQTSIPTACQTGSCGLAGRCIYPVNPGYCVVPNNTCVLNGTDQPGNPCRKCYSHINQYAYVPDNFAQVNDGNVCNGVEVCSNGFLTLNPPPLVCNNPNSPCVNGTCDPLMGCILTPLPDNSTCVIPNLLCSIPFTCSSGQCQCNGALVQIQGYTRGVTTAIVVGVITGTLFLLILLCWCIEAYHDDRRRRKRLYEKEF